MRTETIHNMIMVFQHHAEDPAIAKILTPARIQMEDLLMKSLPEINVSEANLPTKRMRADAYMRRTKCSSHLAHVVVNRSWRERKFTEKINKQLELVGDEEWESEEEEEEDGTSGGLL